ncbi:unnamed protein product [Closterium sp. NIES-65]|nr:unnamed protein product [Closterium sp. NIES-65]
MQEAEQPTELLSRANYAALTKLNQQQGQHGKPGGGGSGGGRSAKDVNEKRSTRDKGRRGGGRRRECWICGDPDHLSFECPNHNDSDEDDNQGGRGRSASHRPHRDEKPHKEKQASKKTSLTKNIDSSSGKSRGDEEASCSMVGVVEPTVLLAPEAGKDFQAVAAGVQANPMAVLLDSGCSHHMMGTKSVFVDMGPSNGVKHVRGFNGALQPVEGRGTVALQGEARKRVLIPDVLYVPGIQANLLSAGQLKESGVQLQGDGDKMLLAAASGEVLDRARYTERVLCTDLRPCSTQPSSTEVVALRTIVSATKTTPDRMHARLAHVSVDTIKSSAKHDVADGLDITSSTGADSPCVSCVGGKLARHTFPAKGSDAAEALAVVHIDMCGPFRVAAKDGSLYFLLLKDRHTRFVWAMPVAKKSDVLREFRRWQFLVPDQQPSGKLAPKARWGLHLGVSPESKGWEVLDLTDNKVVTSVEVIFYETLLLEVWKATYGSASERMQAYPPTDTSTATIPLLAKVDESAVEDVVEVLPPPPVLAPPFPVEDRPGPAPVSTTDDEGSLEASPVAPAHGIAGGRQGVKLVNQNGKPSATEEQQTGEPIEQEVTAAVQPTGEQQPGRPTGELSKSASDEQPVEGSKQLVDDEDVDEEGEQSAGEESTESDVVEVRITKPELRRRGRARRPSERLSFLAYLPPAAFTTVFDEVDDDLLYDDAEEDEDLPELDPEHRWDIATMTVKEALSSRKGEAVKAAMKEEICSLIGMGTWELVERPRGVNIMKNRWVLTTKYRIDDTVEREKAGLVVKGFTQVYGADYDKAYSPVSSYVTLRIFLSIVAVLDLNLMQLDMKNAFLKSKLDRVLYMYQPDYFDDGTGRVCKLLKSLYGLKQSPLLWYKALDEPGRRGAQLLGASWKKSQVDEALYFKAGDDKYLGLEIMRDRSARKLWLHQQGYADKLRRRFINEEQGGPVPKMPVSVDAYAQLTFDDEEAQEREEEEYRQKVGSLQFAATTSRPDIAFACNKLGSGLTVRSDQHWREVDHCLAYLADTRDTALELGGGPELLELIGYVDADDAGNKQNRTSTGGYVFVYEGTAVSWSSSRIKCATLSSTESEYVAATDAGKEGRRLRFLLA